MSQIYEMVKSYRKDIPQSYQSIIRGTIEAASSDSEVWKKKKNPKLNLFYSVDGIGGGMWGLRSLEKLTPSAIDLSDHAIGGGNFAPVTKEFQIYRVIRDTKLCREVKKLHDHNCQICSESLTLPDGRKYAEAHHIIPLGKPHHGPDTAENIIVVCPNHHAMLDYGVIALDPELIVTKKGHTLACSSIDYHNQSIHNKFTASI